MPRLLTQPLKPTFPCSVSYTHLDVYKRQNLHEMAEHLDVTEEFLKDALDAYLLKYGKCTVVDNYMVFFEPLGVVDMNYGIE